MPSLGESVEPERIVALAAAKRVVLVLFVVLLLALPVIASTTIVRASSGGGENIPVYGDRVVVIEVKGTIDGAMEDYVRAGLAYAERENAIAVLALDTPGGWLVNALEIVGEVEDARIPVVGFVNGKWAMSAGTLLLFCSHIAAMKPGSIIGAAQPVMFNPSSGTYTPVNESKIVNPVVGKIRACTELRLRSLGVPGPNITRAAEEAVKVVTENKVFGASEAKKAGVVDVVASNIYELLEKLNGTLVMRPEAKYTIIVHGTPSIEYYRMGIGLRVAHFLADPVISSLLSTLGILVILASLFTGHPYGVALGVALILLSLLGMGYSASLIGIVLLVVGLILLIIELTVIPGFGVVGSTGIGLLVLGLIMLPAGTEPVAISPQYMQQVMVIVLSVAVPLGGFMGLIVYKAVKAWKQKPVYTPSVVGKEGRAIDDIGEGGEGFVIVEGEYWRARALKPVKRGCKVVVRGKEGPIVLVEPVEECGRVAGSPGGVEGAS